MTDKQKQFFIFFWIFLCFLIVGFYHLSVNSPFVYDDKIEVIGNRSIRYLDKWSEIVIYNPSRIFLQFTYAFNLDQSKFDPFGYHVLNMVIHCFGAGAALWMMLQFHLTTRKTSFPYFAPLVTAIWALHPMATESVIYITGRSESLCALFCFLAIGSWLISFREKSWLWIPIALLFTIFAATTKEVGLMLPFVFIFLEYQLADRIRWKLHFPMFGIIVFGVFARMYGLIAGLEEDQTLWDAVAKFFPRESERSIATQLLTQSEVWLRYIILWIIPYEQTIFHDIPDREAHDLSNFYAAGAWFLTAFVAWRSCKNSPLARCALVIGTLMLLPSSSFAPLKESMAEHRTHQFGLFFLLFLSTLKPSLSTKPIIATLSFTLIPLGYMTYKRNLLWNSEVDLWREAVHKNMESAEAWYGLGDAYRFIGDLRKAEKSFVTCVELDKTYLNGWINLGMTRAQQGEAKGAKKAWKEVLLQKPTSWKKSHCKAHNNLGKLAGMQEQWEVAIAELHSTIGLCSNNIIAHYLLGEIHSGPRFHKKKAIYYYERVLELDPTFDKAEEVRKKLLELTW